MNIKNKKQVIKGLQIFMLFSTFIIGVTLGGLALNNKGPIGTYVPGMKMPEFKFKNYLDQLSEIENKAVFNHVIVATVFASFSIALGVASLVVIFMMVFTDNLNGWGIETKLTIGSFAALLVVIIIGSIALSFSNDLFDFFWLHSNMEKPKPKAPQNPNQPSHGIII